MIDYDWGDFFGMSVCVWQVSARRNYGAFNIVLLRERELGEEKMVIIAKCRFICLYTFALTKPSSMGCLYEPLLCRQHTINYFRIQ